MYKRKNKHRHASKFLSRTSPYPSPEFAVLFLGVRHQAENELQHKINMDVQKLELDKLSKAANIQVQKERIESEEEREVARIRVRGAEIGAKLTTEEEKNQTATKKIRADLLKEGLATGKSLADDQTNGE